MNRWLLRLGLIFLASLVPAGCKVTTGTGAQCSVPAPCGGDPTGTWQITDSCVSGIEEVINSDELPAACSNLITDTDAIITGNLSFGQTQVTTTASVTAELTVNYSAACLGAQGVATVTADTCTSIADGLNQSAAIASSSCSLSDGGCVCAVTGAAEPVGGYQGGYQVSGNDLVIDGESEARPFCIDGDIMTIEETSSSAVGTMTLLRLQ